MGKNKRKNNNDTNSKLRIIISIIIFTVLVFTGYIEVGFTEISENSLNTQNTANVVNSSNKTNNVNNKSIKIDKIPKYSGKIVIDINNDVPYFEEKDVSTKNFEIYSELDSLNRAQVAFANISKYTMPSEGVKRGKISYKPSGWIQYLYGKNKEEHLYERCHLIAWQLGNENNNYRNLITGTAQMNEAMIEYENMVAKWIKQKNEQGKNYHVLYRVTPIYSGDNLVATGVEMEAKSVEEEGISFNKFIYNVQDNFEINYATGKAKLNN